MAQFGKVVHLGEATWPNVAARPAPQHGGGECEPREEAGVGVTWKGSGEIGNRMVGTPFT